MFITLIVLITLILLGIAITGYLIIKEKKRYIN